MPKIILEIIINAPKELVFELARSIDFHKESTKHTNEYAIAGKTSGLLNLGESVTWRAKHFGLWLVLESKMTELEFPNYFVDEMQRGNFKSFHHKHIFTEENNKTTMIDIFDYKSPYGFLGKIIDWLFLENYMRDFLLTRNILIKERCECK
mgnify:CR=1 FL=1